MTLLALHGVSKSYGALKVTDGITLAVAEGETLASSGPTARARPRCSTLISGDARVDAGRVEYEGRDVTAAASAPTLPRAASAAATRCTQPFGNMSVFENLVDRRLLRRRSASRKPGRRRTRCWRRPGSGARQQAGRLASRCSTASGSNWRARCRPQLLLLDEIAGGLTEPEGEAAGRRAHSRSRRAA